MPINQRLRILTAFIVIALCLGVAGSIDLASALEQEAQDKLDRARHAEQGEEPEFFMYGPLQCPLRKRVGLGEWIYSGWIIEKSDASRPTGACIYRKLI